MRRVRGILACGLASLGAGCGGEAVPEIADPPSQASEAFATVDTATVTLPLLLPAQLYVEHDALVYARSMGIVESVHVDIGDRVRRGQVLAKVENVDQAIALADAEASSRNAEVLVRRVRELAGSGAVTVADSEKAELDAQLAALNLRQAQRDYDLTRAVAPFAGVVTGRTVRLGRLVEELDPLFRVTAMRPLRASVQLPEQAGIVEPGQTADVVALDGTVVDATVERVSPTIDPTSGTREVILRVASRSGLRPGASVHVRLGAEPRTVLVVPSEAIADGGHLLVRENGRTVLRAVTLGATLEDGRVEVLSGASLGERLHRP